MQQTSEKNYAIYSRKSKFTGKGESVENQVEMCRQYIRADAGETVAAAAAVYEDEGFSGGNLARPAFQRMMRDARAKRLLAVVVYRLDRISRNIGDFARLIEELEALGVQFISIREQFHTSSPMGRAMMYIASVFSQLERETIAERIRDNMRELARTGRWLGGITPTGYRSECVCHTTPDGKTRKSYRLQAMPAELQIIREIFQIFLAGGSLTATEARLLQRGAVTKNGRPFSRFALRGILTNPVYMTADEDAYAFWRASGAELCAGRDAFDGRHGMIAYNRTRQQPGHSNQLRARAEWIIAVGGHEGAVSGQDWAEAQRLLERNRSRACRAPQRNTALLPGLLRCGACGGAMYAKLSGRTTDNGARRFFYRCAMKERSRCACCRAPNAPGNALDAALLQAVTQWPEDRVEFLRRLETERKRLLQQADGERAEQDAVTRQLREGERELHRLMDALSRSSGETAAFLLHRMEEQSARQTALRRHLETQPDRQTALPVSFSALLAAAPVEMRRTALRQCVRALTWDGTNVQVVLYGAEPLCADSK